jgi:hypothetical protein
VMEATRYESAKRAVESLPTSDQLRLIAEVVSQLSDRVEPRSRSRLTELRGLGKEIWEGIDAGDYVRQERSSWER